MKKKLLLKNIYKYTKTLQLIKSNLQNIQLYIVKKVYL